MAALIQQFRIQHPKPEKRPENPPGVLPVGKNTGPSGGPSRVFSTITWSFAAPNSAQPSNSA
jgi:hypothetical protein